MYDSYLFAGLCGTYTGGRNRLLSGTRGDHRLSPSPHTLTQKDDQAAASQWWQGVAKCGLTQRLIQGCDGGWLCQSGFRGPRRYCGVFFTLSARSRPRMHIEIECLLKQLRQSARSDRLARRGLGVPTKNLVPIGLLDFSNFGQVALSR